MGDVVLKIGDFVRLHTSDDYDGLRGFITTIENDNFRINCEKKGYDYFVKFHEAENIIEKIL